MQLQDPLHQLVRMNGVIPDQRQPLRERVAIVHLAPKVFAERQNAGHDVAEIMSQGFTRK